MKIDHAIELLKAGFTKDEIMSMIQGPEQHEKMEEEQKPEALEEEQQPEEEPARGTDTAAIMAAVIAGEVSKAVAGELKGIRESFSKFAINSLENKEQKADDWEGVLASLINPPGLDKKK